MQLCRGDPTAQYLTLNAPYPSSPPHDTLFLSFSATRLTQPMTDLDETGQTVSLRSCLAGRWLGFIRIHAEVRTKIRKRIGENSTHRRSTKKGGMSHYIIRFTE